MRHDEKLIVADLEPRRVDQPAIEDGGPLCSSSTFRSVLATAKENAMKRISVCLAMGTLVYGLSFTTPAPAAEEWIQLGPTGGPPAARGAHVAVYDPVSNQMIVFGGGKFSGSIPDFHRRDLWSLSDANGIGAPVWTQVAPGGPIPSGRFAHRAAYDEANDRMIVFGGGLGGSSPCVNDVQVLVDASGAGGTTPTWTQLAPTGGPPPARFGHVQVYDPATNSLIVHSGSNCFTAPSFNDVWVLSHANGLGGAPVWTQLFPGGIVTPNRVNHTAVYDAASNRMIVFGGGAPGSVLTNDVFVLTDANGSGSPAWTQLSPTGGPPAARSTHSAVYDAVANEMIVFGGNAPGLTNDLWVLSDADGIGTPAWTELFPSGTLPSARGGHSAVFDPGTKRMTVFGGNFLNDVWVLASTVFSCAGGGFAPPFDDLLVLEKKKKGAIPVKMTLLDGGVAVTDVDVPAPPVINVSFVPTGGGPAVPLADDLLPVGQANEDNMFRFDAVSEQWIYNLGTKLLESAGTYTVTAVAGDASYTIDSSCTGAFERLP